MTAVLGPVNRTGPQGEPGQNGEDGLDGSRWYSGKGEPDKSLGVNGDFYLDKANGDFYEKENDEWYFVGNLKGPKGAKGDKGDKGIAGLNGSVSVFTYTFTQKGFFKETYNEKNILASSIDNVVQYTVPIGKKFDLLQINSSGDNIAKFTILVNGDVLAKYRTYFTHYDREYVIGRHTCYAGDIVTLVVDNFRNADADFNATIIGDLYE